MQAISEQRVSENIRCDGALLTTVTPVVPAYVTSFIADLLAVFAKPFLTPAVDVIASDVNVEDGNVSATLDDIFTTQLDINGLVAPTHYILTAASMFAQGDHSWTSGSV